MYGVLHFGGTERPACRAISAAGEHLDTCMIDRDAMCVCVRCSGLPSRAYHRSGSSERDSAGRTDGEVRVPRAERLAASHPVAQTLHRQWIVPPRRRRTLRTRRARASVQFSLIVIPRAVFVKF